MISVAYINNGYEPLLASNPFLSFDKMVLEMSQEIDNQIASFEKTLDQYMIESEIMGELDEEKSVYLEAEKGNIFDKIGNAVIAIGKALVDTIRNIIEWITGAGFRGKSDLEKANEVLNEYKTKLPPKEYEKLSQEFIDSVWKGGTGINETKNLAEASKIFDEMIKLSKQQSTDPNTLKGKFEALKKALDESEDSKINKVAKVGKNVLGLAVTVATLKATIFKSKKDIMDQEKVARERNKELINAIETLKTMDGGKYSPENMTKAQILKNAYIVMNNETKDLILAEQGKLKDCETGIKAWLTKYAKAKRDELLSSVDRISQSNADKEREARQKKLNEDYEDEHNKATARIVAQDQATLGKKYDNNASIARNHNKAKVTDVKRDTVAKRETNPKPSRKK